MSERIADKQLVDARGRITAVGGPVLTAETEGAFHISEAVHVGANRLLGEVLRINGDHIVVQVYEDTTGLRPGDLVAGTGKPLSIQLGPSLLGGIFDGLLRPLVGTDDVYVRPGSSPPRSTYYHFEPSVQAGSSVTPGQVLGSVSTPERRSQKCLVPPDVLGRVTELRPAGTYADDEPLCWIERPTGTVAEVSMSHPWPVRRPRPVLERLPLAVPLLTGQRIVDMLFPVARGSTAAMPGGFGTGKTIFQQTVAKWCDADVIVYVGCGERGNEMAEVLREFPELQDPSTGRTLIERSIIIANTSNMPVSAREASIYTGVTVAEYFRDQGLHVALLADSTSRWAEALREIAVRLGELPAEGGYPAYLGTRLAEFYERAARVRTLSGAEGSVTLIGAVSPPGGDFSEPVTLHTQRQVRCFWPLDRDRAQARFYPAIHPLRAYSEDDDVLSAWWRDQGHAEHRAQRQRFLTLLEDRARLERMARIVGKDALLPRDQLTLLSAALVNEGFLRQSAFSAVDAYATPKRQIAMMRTLSCFIDGADRAVTRGVPITEIESLPLLRRLRRLGEEFGDEDLDGFESLQNEIDAAFADLTRVVASGGANDAG
jgi:V/A-type H+-transporting ATPase subunit A